MNNLLNTSWEFLSGIATNLFEIVTMAFSWLFGIVVILHNDMPRVEGLLVGILFAWFFIHRDKNPVVRALAAPLKIVLDILDIIWDETLESIRDLYTSCKEKLMSVLGSIKVKVSGLLEHAVNALRNVKDGLLNRFKKDPEA